jgi:hypothetical protein
MFKPFVVALAVGFGIVWLYRNWQVAKNKAAVTYTGKNGDPVYAGPDVDPITGTYVPPQNQPGTVDTMTRN